MNKYENKTVFFIGDSITANGKFVHLLRLYFKENGYRVHLQNKGIPGGTAELIHEALEEELEAHTPDFAVISFGANDVAYYEYNTDTIGKEALSLIKKAKLEEYCKNMTSLVIKLKARGITPILCSPFCFNRYLNEEVERETVVDLCEKEAIDYKFYSPTVFEKINESLLEFSGFVKSLAKENGFEFWDLYKATYEKTTPDCFESDGIHYTPKGDFIIAEYMLEKMCNQSIGTPKEDVDCQEIAKLELDEISYFFIKYNIMRQKHHSLTDEELVLAVKEWIAENGNVWGMTSERVERFSRFVNSSRENRHKLFQKIRNI